MSAGVVAVLNATVLASPSSADDRTVLTIVGTSDVSDSGLMSNVIEPEFEAANPQYDLQYVPKGTGAAITYAEQGSASALIVHAAAVENQFVGDGYSLEKWGRAIFWGDFILAGPTDDPAGILSGDSTYDIRSAFEKLAAAGDEGKIDFVSRGGTPGTTIQEHQIWAATTGVQTCEVSAANGGGTTPSTTTGACPSTVDAPSWYHVTGLNQGLNVDAANSCSTDTFSSGKCYVFTDRGTFQYRQSQGLTDNLQLVTRPDKNGDADISNWLVNSFHAYAIDPETVAENLGVDQSSLNIDTVGATAFLDWITSPTAQRQIGAFLDDDPDDDSVGDPPFIPSAAPNLIVTSEPAAKVTGGKKVTIKGTLSNEVPGTPALDGVKVTLEARPVSAPGANGTAVATTTTKDDGSWSISYKPAASQLYTVSVDQIEKIEIDTLDPVFGDILQPTSSDAGKTVVVGAVTVKKAKVVGGKLQVSGALKPKVTGSKATVTLYAGHPGKKLTKHGTAKLKAGATSYAAGFKLGKGTWKYQLRYANNGVINTGSSKTAQVKVS